MVSPTIPAKIAQSLTMLSSRYHDANLLVCVYEKRNAQLSLMEITSNIFLGVCILLFSGEKISHQGSFSVLSLNII